MNTDRLTNDNTKLSITDEQNKMSILNMIPGLWINKQKAY